MPQGVTERLFWVEVTSNRRSWAKLPDSETYVFQEAKEVMDYQVRCNLNVPGWVMISDPVAYRICSQEVQIHETSN